MTIVGHRKSRPADPDFVGLLDHRGWSWGSRRHPILSRNPHVHLDNRRRRCGRGQWRGRSRWRNRFRLLCGRGRKREWLGTAQIQLDQRRIPLPANQFVQRLPFTHLGGWFAVFYRMRFVGVLFHLTDLLQTPLQQIAHLRPVVDPIFPPKNLKKNEREI